MAPWYIFLLQFFIFTWDFFLLLDSTEISKSVSLLCITIKSRLTPSIFTNVDTADKPLIWHIRRIFPCHREVRAFYEFTSTKKGSSTSSIVKDIILWPLCQFLLSSIDSIPNTSTQTTKIFSAVVGCWWCGIWCNIWLDNLLFFLADMDYI